MPGDRSRQRAWVLLMLALPWVGAIIYFWVHRHGRRPPPA